MGLRERLRGREAWRSINKVLIVGIYTILVFGSMVFRQYMGWVLLGVAFFASIYINFFTNHLRNMEKLRKGDEVFGGWIEHRHGQGEEKYFYPESIVPYSRLSETDKEAVDDFIKYVDKLTKERIKMDLEAKESKEPIKLLSYEEKEKMEQDELEGLKDEYDEIHEEEKPEVEITKELGEQEDD